MLYKKLCAIVLMSALVISSACVTAFAAKEEEVVEETEILWDEENYPVDLLVPEYSSYADFKNEIFNRELFRKLNALGTPVKVTNKIYTLQTKKSVSNLKFDYREGNSTKMGKENLQLQLISCDSSSVEFSYDKNVSFTYFPDYRTGTVNRKKLYEDAKKNAIKSRVIHQHKVYVTNPSKKEYLYTWVQDGNLFQIRAPKNKDMNYGFALCKLVKAHTFEQENTPVQDAGSVEEVAEIDVLYPAYTSAELAKNSSNIVVGTVQSIEPNYSNSGDYYSRVKIAVKENLKGTVSNQTISIPMFGGIKDGVAHRYEGAPAYMVGEEVLLYLNPFSSAGKNWYIPITFDATLNLNPPVNRQAIIAQVREDIEVSELEKTFAEGTTVGEPVEDIMLDWE